MIERFGTLYAGHVDFEDLGYDATPVNQRFLANDRLVTAFDKAANPGLEEINVNLPVGTPQRVIVDQLERFAREVMPAFRGG
jgi:hypothetical protein